jgi:L-seryl-tRNA(Ser) seleniumtransferase
MAASGAVLVEVGTTNRTRPSDYATAAATAAVILKVHPSNYRVEGFHESVSHSELAALASRHPGTELVADIGSGLLDAGVPWLAGPAPAWLAGEPGVRQTVAAGAGATLFSGDKLLGGPQAGIAVGSARTIERMATHPAARALRSDSGTLAALAATLELYADGRGAEVPFWQMASLGYAELEARARRVLADAAIDGTVIAGESLPGAGSVPGQTIPSPVIALPGEPDRRWRLLVAGDPVIVARRLEGHLLIDLRTVPATDDAAVAAALSRACR